MELRFHQLREGVFWGGGGGKEYRRSKKSGNISCIIGEIYIIRLFGFLRRKITIGIIILFYLFTKGVYLTNKVYAYLGYGKKRSK